ncbi:alpha-hydroxy-acid oxidizing protein [Lentilactobacillus senioris]|uniref:alpha-hydroxy-acid oxidizing protein n=1 Tax=Lentilactobacillus senioris TaxID=931534 RepID=UPI000AB573CE
MGGLSTVESLLESQPVQQQLSIIASGGVQDPSQVAKALALGSSAVGVAGYFLNQLFHFSDEEIITNIKEWQYGVKSIMAMLNTPTLADLRKTPLIFNEKIQNYRQQRNLK